MGITNEELYTELKHLGERVANLEAVALGRSDSIELSKNSRGHTWSVKVYNNEGEIALEKVKALDKKLGEAFGSEVG